MLDAFGEIDEVASLEDRILYCITLLETECVPCGAYTCIERRV